MLCRRGERRPLLAILVQPIERCWIRKREIDLRGVSWIGSQDCQVAADVRQRIPGTSSIFAAVDGQAGLAVNDLGLSRRYSERGNRSLAVHQLKRLPAVQRGIDARVTGCIDRATRPCRCYIIDTAHDTLEYLPVIPTIGAACHAVAAIGQQLTRSSGNGKHAKDQSKR